MLFYLILGDVPGVLVQNIKTRTLGMLENGNSKMAGLCLRGNSLPNSLSQIIVHLEFINKNSLNEMMGTETNIEVNKNRQ